MLICIYYICTCIYIIFVVILIARRINYCGLKVNSSSSNDYKYGIHSLSQKLRIPECIHKNYTSGPISTKLYVLILACLTNAYAKFQTCTYWQFARCAHKECKCRAVINSKMNNTVE